MSINPTEGRIGTQITATITDCTPPTTGDGQARLDFSFPDLTPANTVFFTPAADGTATVTIEAMEKEGQSEDRNYAEVVVSQCGSRSSGAACASKRSPLCSGIARWK